jgi:hypothetical protein
MSKSGRVEIQQLRTLRWGGGPDVEKERSKRPFATDPVDHGYQKCIPVTPYKDSRIVYSGLIEGCTKVVVAAAIGGEQDDMR